MRQRLIRHRQLNVAEGVNTRALRDDGLAHLMEPLPWSPYLSIYHEYSRAQPV